MCKTFVPERLKVSGETQSRYAARWEPVAFDATAKFLYGAPGSGLGVEADAVVRACRAILAGRRAPCICLWR